MTFAVLFLSLSFTKSYEGEYCCFIFLFVLILDIGSFRVFITNDEIVCLSFDWNETVRIIKIEINECMKELIMMIYYLNMKSFDVREKKKKNSDLWIENKRRTRKKNKVCWQDWNYSNSPIGTFLIHSSCINLNKPSVTETLYGVGLRSRTWSFRNSLICSLA